MTLFTPFRNWWSRRRVRSRATTSRPGVEALECRTLPATFSTASATLFLTNFVDAEQIEVTKTAADKIQIALTTPGSTWSGVNNTPNGVTGNGSNILLIDSDDFTGTIDIGDGSTAPASAPPTVLTFKGTAGFGPFANQFDIGFPTNTASERANIVFDTAASVFAKRLDISTNGDIVVNAPVSVGAAGMFFSTSASTIVNSPLSTPDGVGGSGEIVIGGSSASSLFYLNANVSTGRATDAAFQGQTSTRSGRIYLITAGDIIGTEAAHLTTGNASSTVNDCSAFAGNIALEADGEIRFAALDNALRAGNAVFAGPTRGQAFGGIITFNSARHISSDGATGKLSLRTGSASGGRDNGQPRASFNAPGSVQALMSDDMAADNGVYLSSNGSLRIGDLRTYRGNATRNVEIETTGGATLTIDSETFESSLDNVNIVYNANNGALVLEATNGNVVNIGAGNLTLIGDEIDIDGNGLSVSGGIRGTGALLLKPGSASRPINLGGTSSLLGALNLTASDLSAFANGFSSVTIGNAADATGLITAAGNFTFQEPTTIHGGSFLGGGGTLGTTATNDLTLHARTGPIGAGSNRVIVNPGANLVLTADAANGDADLFVTTVNALTLGGPNFTFTTGSGRDTVDLKTSSGAITIAANITLDDDLALDAAGDFVINPGLTLTARTLAVTGATATTNATATLRATSGPLSIRSTNGALGGVGGGTLALVTLADDGAGDVSVSSAAALTIGTTGLTVATGSGVDTVDVRTTAGDLTVVGNPTTNDELILRAAGALIFANFTTTAPFNAGSADVTLVADEINVVTAGAIADSLTGTGDLVIEPRTAGLPVHLGGSGDTAGQLDLTAAELSAFKDGFSSITLGNTADSTSTTSFVGDVTFLDPTTIHAANFLGVGGTLSSSAGTSLVLHARTGSIGSGSNRVQVNPVGSLAFVADAADGDADVFLTFPTALNLGTAPLSFATGPGTDLVSLKTTSGDITVTADVTFGDNLDLHAAGAVRVNDGKTLKAARMTVLGTAGIATGTGMLETTVGNLALHTVTAAIGASNSPVKVMVAGMLSILTEAPGGADGDAFVTSPGTLAVGEIATGPDPDLVDIDATNLAVMEASSTNDSVQFTSGGTVNLDFEGSFQAQNVNTNAQGNIQGGGMLETSAAAGVVLISVNGDVGTNGVPIEVLLANGGKLVTDSNGNQYIATPGTVAIDSLDAGGASITLSGDGTYQLTDDQGVTAGTLILEDGTTLDIGPNDILVGEFNNQGGNVVADGGLITTTSGTIHIESGEVTGIAGPTGIDCFGTSNVSGANPYTGPTTVVGVVHLEPDANIENSTTTVEPGGTVTGTGTAGDVIMEPLNPAEPGVIGLIIPGESPGILTTKSLTMGTGAKLVMEIFGATPGTGAGKHDQVVARGSVTLNGAVLSVDFGAFSPSVGNEFVLIANDGSDAINGTFAGLAQGATVTVAGGRAVTISYVGGTGNDVSLIVGTDRAPVFSSSPVTSATEGSVYTYNITTTDADAGDTLTITAPTKPAWLTFTDFGNKTARLTGTPGNADVGTHAVVLDVFDGTAHVQQSYTITVADSNRLPTFTSSSSTSISEDSAYTYNIAASDADAGDTLVFTATVKPAWLTFTDNGNRTAKLMGTPVNANVGPHNVTIDVFDGTAHVQQSFTINVNNTNDAPTFTSSPGTAALEDSPYTYNITTTDVDVGASLTVTAPTKPAWLTFTAGPNGTATLSGTPVNANVGTHNVVLRVSDGTVNVQQSFTIIVSDNNNLPAFSSTPVTGGVQDRVYTYNITATDADAANTLVFTAPTLPGWLNLLNNGNRSATLTGTPGSGDLGSHSVVLDVFDGQDHVQQTFAITVIDANHAPFGANRTISTRKTVAYTFAGADFGFGDFSETTPNNLLAVKITTLPSAGTLSNDGNAVSAGQFIAASDLAAGKLTFTPGADAVGAGYASFTFQVQDDGGTANTGIDLDPTPNAITIDIFFNHAPAGANKTVSTTPDTAYTFTVSDFGFSDPNDTPANGFLAVTITTTPAAGSLTRNNVDVAAGAVIPVSEIQGGNLKYVPPAGVSGNGIASFTFQVQDDGGTDNGGADLDASPNTITLNVAEQFNDLFAQRRQLSGASISVTGTNVGATKEAGEPNHAGNAGGKSVWWTWTAPASGSVTIDTSGSAFDTILGVYTGSAVNALTLVASDDDSGAGNTSAVTFSAVSGVTYQIAVDGFSGASGAIQLNLNLAAPPANDNFANRQTFTGTSAMGTNALATKEAGEPNHAGNSGGASVWWTWTAPSSGRATIDTIGSNFDTLLGVYTGSAVNALTQVGSDDDGGGNGTSRATFSVTAGTAYQIAVDGFSGDTGTIQLHLALNVAPTVANPIPDQGATQGQPFAFTFAANTFADPGDTLTFTTGTRPAWLGFNAATRTLSGTPPTRGTVNLTVTATDSAGGSVSETFSIVVGVGVVAATGAATGLGTVTVFDAVSGQTLATFTAYSGSGYNGGARVAVADVTGDDVPDVITASGPNLPGGALIKVYDGTALLSGTATELFSFHPYGASYLGEVFVAAGDFNADNRADIVTSNVATGPTVKVFDAADLAGGDPVTELRSVRPFGASYKGGARIAVGDVNGDGTLDLIAGQSKNGAQFRAISGVNFSTVLMKATLSTTAISGGVFVAAGNLDGDSKVDVVVGLGSGAKSLVQVYEDASNADTKATLLKKSTPIYGTTFKGGVRVATADLDGDGRAEVLTTAGSVPPNYRLRVLNGLTLAALDAYFSQAPDFADARFVAAARLG